MPSYKIGAGWKKKPKKDYSQYLSKKQTKQPAKSTGTDKYTQYKSKSSPSSKPKPKPKISGIQVLNEQSEAQVMQQMQQMGQQEPAQQQGFASKALNSAVEWLSKVPAAAAAATKHTFSKEGLSQTVDNLDVAGLAVGLPVGSIAKKGFGTAAKLGSKEIAKRTAAMAARRAVIKSQYTFKQVSSVLLKQGTKDLTGSTAKAAAGKIVFGRDAAGKLASSLKGWGKTIPPNIYPLNTKTAAKTTSYLKKLGYSATAIGVISGYLFSIPWSLNEKSDALTTITIAQRDAEKAKDWETVAEYDALIQEISDVSWAETLTPFYNVGAAVMDKFKASKITSEKRMEEMRKAQTEGEGEDNTFNQQAVARQESFEEYNTMAFERQQQADEEMQQFWQNYLDQKQAGEEEAREFWAEYQQNKQDFWKAFQENKSKSNLGFGLLR